MFLNFKKGVSVYVLTIFIDFHEITLLYVIFVLEKKNFFRIFFKKCCVLQYRRHAIHTEKNIDAF